LAEFERDIIRERTMAGLEAARARGKKGGRKRVMDERKVALAARLMRNRDVPISEVCGAVGVSRVTLYRYLNPDGSPREERRKVLPPHSGGAEDGLFPARLPSSGRGLLRVGTEIVHIDHKVNQCVLKLVNVS
jgi:hypothetical protein